MAVMDALYNLSPEELGFEFWHLSIGLHLEVAVEAASVDELHYQEDLLVRFESLVELGDVRMVQLLHDLHFALDALAPIGFHQLELLVYFDSNLLIEHFVEAEAYDGVGTLPDALAYEVVVQVLYRAIGGAEFDHLLIRLSLALVHLGLVEWVSIVDFASPVLQVSCRCLRLG